MAMTGKYWATLFLFVGLLLVGTGVALADDLDDGISKFTDDGVDKYDELGEKDRNISFIVQDAKSRANVRAQAGQEQGMAGTTGGGNMNSVILGPGGNVRGDIIIIDQSKGDKTQVVE
ncbi:hypothetical protein [Trichloromonas sp.]|uniref:hypothetical protein n=1 Tax=Trichloromonas sp. TaxID=3069249 RepID=UPI002A4DC349|nr:hypothetical protein [Trichloromonas sp.]